MNVFDIIGPVMIGPSSSHTAGAARIGRMARHLLGEPAVKARILLAGSFAYTYKGHGTDRAIMAGIMDMTPDDKRIRHSLEIAKEQGIDYAFEPGEIENAHPNTARITLEGASGRKLVMQAASVGGGNILVNEINGLKVSISGQFPTLIVVHRDIPGMIAKVTAIMADEGMNIFDFTLNRDGKGGTAVMTIQCDGSIAERITGELESLENVMSVVLITPL
ncbi:MAG: L-serine ammonia-lyase, iron-sulfur-dependent subunit beta [Anaerovoracaceae bacterium]